nr:MAG TPA: hypothetical protein [Caudoviricetes sp.]
MAKKNFELNRKEYLNIKRMDHHQMSLWAESMYKSGFEDGEKAAEQAALTSEELYKVLSDVKGLGEKRINAIYEALEKGFMVKKTKNAEVKEE